MATYILSRNTTIFMILTKVKPTFSLFEIVKVVLSVRSLWKRINRSNQQKEQKYKDSNSQQNLTDSHIMPQVLKLVRTCYELDQSQLGLSSCCHRSCRLVSMILEISSSSLLLLLFAVSLRSLHISCQPSIQLTANKSLH